MLLCKLSETVNVNKTKFMLIGSKVKLIDAIDLHISINRLD